MTNDYPPLSIVIPTLNEEGNLRTLLSRISEAMDSARITYEAIIVDDHSTDSTLELATALSDEYPLIVHRKKGERGKAGSLLEGFEYANYDIVCMIDADLQYPPESIIPMYMLLNNENADLVVSERKQTNKNSLRNLSSKAFNIIFIRMLFRIKYDTQSGLKVFRKRILKNMQLKPSPWSFDLEFIVRTLEQKYKILSYEINFAKRQSGQTKVHILAVSYELGKAALKVRRSTSIKRIRQHNKQNIAPKRLSMSLIIAFLTVLVWNSQLKIAEAKYTEQRTLTFLYIIKATQYSTSLKPPMKQEVLS